MQAETRKCNSKQSSNYMLVLVRVKGTMTLQLIFTAHKNQLKSFLSKMYVEGCTVHDTESWTVQQKAPLSDKISWKSLKGNRKWGCSIILLIMQITDVILYTTTGMKRKATARNLLHKHNDSLIMLAGCGVTVTQRCVTSTERGRKHFTDSSMELVFSDTHRDSSPERWPLSRSWSSAQSGSSAGRPGRSSCPYPASPPWEARVQNAELQGHTEGWCGTFTAFPLQSLSPVGGFPLLPWFIWLHIKYHLCLWTDQTWEHIWTKRFYFINFDHTNMQCITI